MSNTTMESPALISPDRPGDLPPDGGSLEGEEKCPPLLEQHALIAIASAALAGLFAGWVAKRLWPGE